MDEYADDGNDVTDLKCKQDTIMMLHRLRIQLILSINMAAVKLNKSNRGKISLHFEICEKFDVLQFKFPKVKGTQNEKRHYRF